MPLRVTSCLPTFLVSPHISNGEASTEWPSEASDGQAQGLPESFDLVVLKHHVGDGVENHGMGARLNRLLKDGHRNPVPAGR